ncbi:hypothetical protein GCM10027271_12970 [Saccharopolyspora gloriosae]|uniref:Uncharacterized protein n=1 Tax=Saccharopolyspora gloriosae TaxID=455344 RepID=A0A840NS99_9PSEU|nr:hypothetical protein [Saccharopolyspora gloriosae]MBB5072835.1 hypothetical protein [Saccharopolyspora gloriosae]
MAIEQALKRVGPASAAVTRLEVLARFVDELDQDLGRVAFLEDDIVDARRFADIEDQAQQAQVALTRLRDALAAHGGAVVAKGYK